MNDKKTISPLKRFDKTTANSDLPDDVGPRTTITFALPTSPLLIVLMQLTFFPLSREKRHFDHDTKMPNGSTKWFFLQFPF